jgi:hypothetical protein
MNTHRLLTGLVSAVLSAAVVLNAGAVAAQRGWTDRLQDLLKGTTESPAAVGLSEREIAAGLKDALTVGTDTVVSGLGRRDGFNGDPAVHIPLPENLAPVTSALSSVGLSHWLDDLELRLNRAAEAATPLAKTLFIDAIAAMSIDDVMGIYNGGDNAATEYFKAETAAPLADAMRPHVASQLSEVGALRTYEKTMRRYQSIPFVPNVRSDLTDYVTDKAIAGIFHYLGREEAQIRKNPAKRTTELLKRVFGN